MMIEKVAVVWNCYVDPFLACHRLAPLAATLVQLAISRQREFLADASSVELTRNPQGMINALLKLDKSEPMQREVDDASSALFYQRSQKESGLQKLFIPTPPLLSG